MTYPRELYGSAISSDLKALIHALAFRLLDGPTPQHAILRDQLTDATVDRVTRDASAHSVPSPRPHRLACMTRSDVVVIVGSASALSGAVAGGAAMLVAAAVLTPTEPVTAGQVALMVLESAVIIGLAGAVLGTLAAFGFLRRVPLGKFILFTTVGTAAGLIGGWIGGPWAWHHFSLLGLTGFAAGAVLARAAFSRRVRDDTSVQYAP